MSNVRMQCIIPRLEREAFRNFEHIGSYYVGDACSFEKNKKEGVVISYTFHLGAETSLLQFERTSDSIGASNGDQM